MRLPWFAVPVAVAVVAALGLVSPQFAAQAPDPPALDARASDPVTMGWMVGAPPPPDKLIRFADGSWFRFPQTRWSFSNIRQLMPTSVVRRGRRPGDRAAPGRARGHRRPDVSADRPQPTR